MIITKPLAPAARAARPGGALVGGVLIAALLAGCGGSEESGATDAADPGAASAPAGTGQDGPGGPGGLPGTFDLIAAVDGSVLQVQNQMTGQVAVSVNEDTDITAQADATLADVSVGACVLVGSASTGDQSAEAPTELTASTVSLTAATADGCAAPGFGGGPGGGQRPTDRPSERPSDLPSDFPGGPGGGARPGGLGAVGEVISVSDAGFVVEGPEGDVTVMVTADTTYSQQVKATSSALSVGRCARVEGDVDDTGAVTASAIQVSDAVDQQCGR